jgi:RND family efflux transporter MFP subunit
VRAASEGLIEKIWVDRGDMVKAGQVLVTLDSGVERAATEAARYRSTMQGKIRTGESRVEFSTAKYNRREKLAGQSFISLHDRDEALTEKRLAESELVEAKDDRRLAEIEYRRLSEQLRLRTIKSPVDGIVVDRLLSAGELADNRDLRKPILRLADIGTLYVEVLMPIEAFGKLVLGQSVEVLPEPPVGGRYVATVQVIDRVHDAASGTFGVRLEMANPGLKLPAGSSARRTLGFGAEVRGRGELSLGQSIDPVVLDHVHHVDAAPHDVCELTDADRGGIAVAGHAEIDQLSVRKVRPGQHGRHATMHAVEAVRIAEEIIRRFRRATDARQLRDAMRLYVQFPAGLDDRGADRIVPTAGT